jgi:hypothetical protein
VLWRNITDTEFQETPASRIASLSELAEKPTSQELVNLYCLQLAIAEI